MTDITDAKRNQYHQSMVSAEHYNAVRLERDGLAARVVELEKAVDASIDYLGVYCHLAPDVSGMIDALSACKESKPTQSLLIHDAEALEHWAKVLSSSLVEGVPVHRMMSESASLRLQAEDAKK